MTGADREKLKEQLRAMAAGRGDGIDLDTPFHWVVEDLKQPVSFFTHLPSLLPSDSILYLEGTSIVPDMAAFYASHRALNAVEVVRDTIAPAPDIYHVTFSPDVCAALRQFAESHPVAEMFDHIKAYRGETLLFTFHNAFDGWLCISEHVPQDSVARFCEALGLSSHREQTKQRDPEQLRRFVDWLFNQTLTELRTARGDMTATRAAWVHYFRRGFRADLLLDELMTHLPELFRRTQYPDGEAQSVLAMRGW